MKNKTVIVIAGPTASGKTALAIQVAKHFQTEIISADSRQCFREMNIGVAKPSPGELSAVKHHFIDSHSITEEISAAVFESYALKTAEDLFRTNDYIVMAGGTGLYIKAFAEGIDYIPDVDPEIRSAVQEEYKKGGMALLQQMIAGEDPGYFSGGEIHNPHRLMRALEVKRSTGLSIRHFQKAKKAKRAFNLIRFATDLPKEVLHENIRLRVDKMKEAGLEEEVRSLLPYRYLKPLKTVGYSELFRFFDGEISREAAFEEIKKNTRQYAKRQLTWFRKDPDFNWIDPADAKKLIAMVPDA